MLLPLEITGSNAKKQYSFLPAEGLDGWGLLAVYGEVPESGGPSYVIFPSPRLYEVPIIF